MQLIPDIKNAPKLWSLRLAVLAAVLGGAEATLPMWQGLIPDGVFAALSSTLAVGAAVARVIKQRGLG